MKNFLRQPLNWVLIFGILFRFYFALARVDTVWPDEHYQTLEPASHVVWGYGRMVWEWKDGFRPWTGPSIFIPLFLVLKLFGVNGGPIPIYASRLFVALLSSLSLVAFHRWLQKLRFTPFSHFVGLSLFSLHSAFVIWGPNTLTDSIAFIILTLVLPTVFENPTSFKSGLLMGCVFLVRLQTLSLMPGYGIFLLIQKARFKQWVEFSLGYLCCILFMGGLDWVTWGQPFHSLITQLTTGVAVSEKFGHSPAKEYVISMLLTLGPVAWISMFVLFVVSWTSKSRRTLWLFVSLPCLSLLLVHNLLVHKEARFILPFYIAVFFWFLIGVEKLEPRFAWVARISRKTYLQMASVLIALSFWRSGAAHIHSTDRDAFDLEVRIGEDGLLRKPGVEPCVLLVGHHWALMHGQLILSAPSQTVDVDPNEIGKRSVAHCPYALVLKDYLPSFIASAPKDEQWTQLQVGKKSSVVLLRNSVP